MEAAGSKKEFFKNKVAVYFGYNGLKFHGLQKNENVETIEGVLEKALYDAGMIAPYNFGDLKKQGWQRAARTDKGVHALANVINTKLQFNEEFLLKDEPKDEKEDEEEKKEGTLGESEKPSPKKKKKDRKETLDMKKIVAVINSNLPKEIRVHSIKNCTKSFNCKAYARSRLYEYVMPCSVYNTKAVGEALTEEERAAMLTRLQGLAKRFEGTHNYHNYTTKMKANEPQAKRYIMDMKVEVIEIEKTPYYRFLILGQSFIYHQIRKMMGVIVQIVQEGMEDAFLENTFYNNVIKIWLAPPHGLLLNHVNFDFYNKKSDIPEKLLISADDEKGMDEFRYKIVYPIIHSAELYEKAFTGWVDKMKKSGGMEEESGGENDDEGGEGGAD